MSQPISIPNCEHVHTILDVPGFESIHQVRFNDGAEYRCYVSNVSVDGIKNPQFQLAIGGTPRNSWVELTDRSFPLVQEWSTTYIVNQMAVQTLLSRLHALCVLQERPSIHPFVMGLEDIRIYISNNVVYLLQKVEPHLAWRDASLAQSAMVSKSSHLIEAFHNAGAFLFDTRAGEVDGLGSIYVLGNGASVQIVDFLSVSTQNEDPLLVLFFQQYFSRTSLVQILPNHPELVESFTDAKFDLAWSHALLKASTEQNVADSMGPAFGGSVMDQGSQGQSGLLERLGLSNPTSAPERIPDEKPEIWSIDPDREDPLTPLGQTASHQVSNYENTTSETGPGYQIVDDFSKKSKVYNYRKVLKVRFPLRRTKHPFYKCYRLEMSVQKVVEPSLKQQLLRFGKGWIEEKNFPEVQPYYYNRQASNAENDLWAVLDSYTLLKNRPLLWKYMPGFGDSFLYIDTKFVYLFQPWIEAHALPDPSTLTADKKLRHVDTYLNMFEDLHSSGLCFYDVTLASYKRFGNIFLQPCDDSNTGFRCVWIDIEALSPLKHAEKPKYMAPPVYANPLCYEEAHTQGANRAHLNLDGCLQLSNSTNPSSGWAHDLYLLMCSLWFNRYLPYSEFDKFRSGLHLLPNSTKSSKTPPFTFRFLETSRKAPINNTEESSQSIESESSNVVNEPNPTSSVKQVADEPVNESREPKESPTSKDISKPNRTKASTSTFKVRAIDKVIALSLLVGSILAYLLLVVGMNCTGPRLSTKGSFAMIEPLFLEVDVNDENALISQLNAIGEELDAQDSSVSKLLGFYLISQYPDGKEPGNLACPIGKTYPNEKRFHTLYKIRQCADLQAKIEEIEIERPNDLAVQYVARYFDLANCIHHLGGKSLSDKGRGVCTTALTKTHDLLTRRKSIPAWAVGELSLIYMAAVNTNPSVVKDDPLLVKEVCLETAKSYPKVNTGSDKPEIQNVLRTHMDFALNRCLINAGPHSDTKDASYLLNADDLVELVSIIQPKVSWTSKQWYKQLTSNRTRAKVKGEYANPEDRMALSQRSFFSWLADSFDAGEMAPLPNKIIIKDGGLHQITKEGYTVLKFKILDDTESVEDLFGWVEMQEAMDRGF